MKKLSTLITLLAVLSSSLVAQFSLTSVGTPVTEDFSTYTAAGIQPVAGVGELSSNSFAFTGFSDGAVAFGGSNLTIPGDYARGIRYSTSPVVGGGLYAYIDSVSGDRKLWIQPTGADFTPGEVYMRIVNNTGAVLNDVQIAFDITVYNDSIPTGGNIPTRSQSLTLSYSTDSVNYNVIANDTTIGLGDGTYYTLPFSFTLNALNLANGQSMFLLLATNDYSGFGARDELGLDNLAFTALPPSTNATIFFASNSLSVAENVGTTSLALTQTFAAACSVDVMVSGGSATNPADFTFAQTLVFDGITPSANLNIDIIDDAIFEPTENASLMLMNATAGCQTSIVAAILEILDNEIGVSFVQAGGNTNEGAGTFTFDIEQSTAAPCSVEVALIGGSAINPADLVYTSPTLVVFDGITPLQSVSFSLVDDAIVEGLETADFELQNATGSCILGGITTFSANINDNDFPVYPIGLVSTTDASGVADSVNVTCRLVGTVYGVNYRAGIGGLQFVLNDGTGSIWLTAQNQDFGYTVNEGDSIGVQGTILQFNGSTQLVLDTLVVFPLAGTVSPATVISAPFTETQEADLLKINNCYMINPAQWTGNGTSFIIQVSNGVDTFLVRIDNDIDAFTMPAPTCATFNVTGLLNQYDNSNPFTTGYQLLPRSMNDIECIITPEVSIASASATVNENVGTVNVTISIANADANPTSVDATIGGTATYGSDYAIVPTPTSTTITFPAGSSAPITFAVNIIDDALFESTETITLTLSNPTNGATIGTANMTITITDNDPNAIADGMDVKAVNVFPNPGNATFMVKTDEKVSAIEVINFMGQTVLTSQTVNAPISAANLANGVYTVRVITAKGSWLTKWVKQ